MDICMQQTAARAIGVPSVVIICAFPYNSAHRFTTSLDLSGSKSDSNSNR